MSRKICVISSLLSGASEAERAACSCAAFSLHTTYNASHRTLSRCKKVLPRRAISALNTQRLVDTFNDHHNDYQELAHSLNIPRGIAWSIIRRYQRDGEVIVGRRGGRIRPRLADEEMAIAILAIVEDNPAFKLAQINAELRRQLPTKPHVSVASLRAYIAY